MSFLVTLARPLAYASLPLLMLRLLASTSPYAYYLYRVGLFTGTLVAQSSLAFLLSVVGSLIGQKYNVLWAIARTYYVWVSPLMGITFDVDGEEHLETRPAVYIFNHQTMVDILLLGKVLPKHATIVVKKELMYTTPFGPFLHLTGSVLLDRKNSVMAQRSLEIAGQQMQANRISAIIFPEGTRHSEEVPTMLPFKKGAFHLAVQGGIPIVPIVVENYWRMYHKGVFESGSLKVKVLPPVSTAGLTAADVSGLAIRVRDQMLEVLREISVKVPATSSEEMTQESIPPSSDKESAEVPVSDEVVPTSSEAEHQREEQETVDEHKTESVSGSETGSSAHRVEGSENGAETEEDEGMVLVGRP